MRNNKVFDIPNIGSYPLLHEIGIVCRMVVMQQQNIAVIVVLIDVRQNILFQKVSVSLFGKAINNKKLSQTMETKAMYWKFNEILINVYKNSQEYKRDTKTKSAIN